MAMRDTEKQRKHRCGKCRRVAGDYGLPPSAAAFQRGMRPPLEQRQQHHRPRDVVQRGHQVATSSRSSRSITLSCRSMTMAILSASRGDEIPTPRITSATASPNGGNTPPPLVSIRSKATAVDHRAGETENYPNDALSCQRSGHENRKNPRSKRHKRSRRYVHSELRCSRRRCSAASRSARRLAIRSDCAALSARS